MAEKGQGSEQPIELPNVYFNGFQLGLTNSDVNGILMLNNQPTLAISLSYTTAKTLAGALREMIATLEKITGREIMTTNDVGRGIEALDASKDAKDAQPN